MFQDANSNTVINDFSEIASDLPLKEVCAQLHRRVDALLKKKPTSEVESHVQEQTRVALAVIKEALERYDLSSLSISYNGGKDCLVLLILFLACLDEHFTTNNCPCPTTIPSIYAYPPDPFPAVSSFVESSSKTYHLDLAHIPTNPRPTPESKLPKITMRDAFESYLKPRPHIKAIFVGTRRTDPFGGKLTFFDPTDHGWPEFMRIHPVIDWKLADIWAFLRSDEMKGVEYCSIYDQGYTSLGGVGDTAPNPILKDKDGSFRPAYEVVEDEIERLGRE